MVTYPVDGQRNSESEIVDDQSAGYWTHEKLSRLFMWLMGPGQDEQWQALRGTDAALATCFQTCASEVFGGERTHQSIQRCYRRNFNIFKQIYAALQARSDDMDMFNTTDVTERFRLYEKSLQIARDSGLYIWETVNPQAIDIWRQKGWYDVFHHRWHGDPEMVLHRITDPDNKEHNFDFQGASMDSEGSALASRLRVVVHDVGLYRRLLECRQEDAQKVLDSLQGLLDMPQLDASFRRSLIIAAQRISTRSGLYPTCYELKNISLEGTHPVAAGGFADVYKGKFEGQAVCLKAIRIYRNTELEDFLKRFSKEAILWGQLSHPNILPIYGLYRFQGRICLVSPWMDAGDVTTYLKRRPDVSRIQLAVDVAQGLSYLHKNNIIHGDLKGPNILINEAGRACLADFGISSVTDTEVLAWTSHSSAASRGGSVRWQAPELLDIESDEVVKNTEASDVYAWACVCYEIFLGMVPFANVVREAAVIAKIQAGARPSRPPESSTAWRDWRLTEHIWSLMEDCWSGVPRERPNIEQAIERLMPEMASDERLNASGSVWPPARFRKRMHGSFEAMSVSDMDALLSWQDEQDPLVRYDSPMEETSLHSSFSLQPTTSFGRIDDGREDIALEVTGRGVQFDVEEAGWPTAPAKATWPTITTTKADPPAQLDSIQQTASSWAAWQYTNSLTDAAFS